MKLSPFVRIIEGKRGALAYHSLQGNLFLLEPEYLWILKNFDHLSEIEKKSRTKIIRDLMKANYIVDENTDERRFMIRKNAEWMKKVISGAQLRLLNLMISEACNFGCKHCLHKCSIQTGITHGQKKIMKWETAKLAIDKYASMMKKWNIKNLSIHFGSAEPLLNWKVLQKSVEYIRSLDANANLAVNTNLSLLTQAMAKFLRDNKVYISTSLDGPPQGNDAIRTFSNGSGTYDAIIAKFKMLSDIGYPLDGFSVTINDLNFESVNSDFIKWAKNCGFQGIATDIDLINIKNSQRSVDDCVCKLLELRAVCQKLEMENFGSWTTAYDNLVNEPDDDMPTFCKAVKGRNISVNPSGAVFICGHTNSCLGTIGSFDEIFKADSPYVDLVRSRLPGNNPACYGCEIEGVCAGQCQITREVSASTKNTRDKMLCEFYKMVTRKLLERKITAELSSS